MISYQDVKSKGIMNIQHAMTGLILSDDHEVNKELLHLIVATCKQMLQTEDIQIAFEKGDLAGMYKAAQNNYD